ncbi:MAG: single-stranded DNA-binding protein [Candidatus Accumulibacter sp.]|jgi:single-strand selective monofunctional uracil DNA glycosylase|nr:single-stranded DNA-binding protein [Accumulibacter sp.]
MNESEKMNESETSVADRLIAAALKLSKDAGRMTFSPPVSHVYNPLEYAWPAHEQYLRRFGDSRKRIVFVGMNPGPFGMAQCGIPFGEIATVRDWMGIAAPIGKPARENPKRAVEGFACARSEVSGRRLWGLFRERFGTPAAFFAEHFVANYCPLAFFDAGRNLTPDKLPASEAGPLYAVCDEHLRGLAEILEPEWVVGVGGFAGERAALALQGRETRIGRILHPSPASPAANRDWAGTATRQMIDQGIWA